jgi:hypothetical protein
VKRLHVTVWSTSGRRRTFVSQRNAWGIPPFALARTAHILLCALDVLRASTRVALPIGLVLLAAAVAPTPSHTQTPTLESFRGTYVHTGARGELRAMGGAIDRVVNQMNIFVREIARGEVHRRITPEQRIEIGVPDPQAMTIAMDGWGPVRVALDAAARRVRGATGEDVNLTVRFEEGRLVQRAATPRGSRTNVFTLSPDLEQLSMLVRIASDQLPAEIRYRLTYRRAD